MVTVRAKYEKIKGAEKGCPPVLGEEDLRGVFPITVVFYGDFCSRVKV